MLWCWRRRLRILWTVRRSNQSVLKEISTKYSLEGQMLKLKLQYFGHLMWRTDSLEKTWCWERLKVEGEENDRGWDGWMSLSNSGSWLWTWRPGMLQSMVSQRVGHDWATELNWTNSSYNIILLARSLKNCLLYSLLSNTEHFTTESTLTSYPSVLIHFIYSLVG